MKFLTNIHHTPLYNSTPNNTVLSIVAPNNNRSQLNGYIMYMYLYFLRESRVGKPLSWQTVGLANCRAGKP